MWNSLDDNLRNSFSLNSFKYNLEKDNFASVKIPIYYTYGDRYLSVMHARIRNKCSTLKDFKNAKKRNFFFFAPRTFYVFFNR